ncbi:MAG: hypothetical protein HRT45_13650 [Bdellovibrionales bacterium]|nr:hypothetical protein [Bdellovibrionales bacterium]
MKTLKLIRFGLFLSVALLPAQAAAKYSDFVCPDLVVSDAAWSINETHFSRMLSDMNFEDSASHSRHERVTRILKRIEANQSLRVHKMPLSNQQLAETILWAAECTGNDYRVFTAILEVESYICGDRTGPNGDSGCSMFTTSAVNVFRNQLRLPNKKSSGTELGQQAYQQLIESCYSEHREQRLPGHSRDNAEQFVELYSGTTRNLKRVFVEGSRLHADLLSGAIHLKLNATLAGGYWIPGRAPGGVNRYNASKHAASYSRNVKSRLNQIDIDCYHDRQTPAIQFGFCLMGDQPEACLQNWSYYYEGVSGTL